MPYSKITMAGNRLEVLNFSMFASARNSIRMLGTFNQHLPVVLPNNNWHQSKPTSIHNTGRSGWVKWS